MTRHRRRGSVYLAVLGTALLVTVIGLSALTAIRVQRRWTESSADFSEARFYAQSAIQMGLHWMVADTSWRSNRPHGSWVTNMALGSGAFSLNVIDPNDADLSDSVDDEVLMTATATLGEACYKLSVQVAPYGPRGIDTLASAVHTGEQFRNYGTSTATAPISANGNIWNSGTINADVEAAGSVFNFFGTINGTITQGADPKEMPDASIITAYAARATPITLADLNFKGGEYRLQKNVLSPASNPFGGVTNPEGLYVINCAGNTLVVKNMRIVGTLILLNTGANTRTDGAIHWQPATADEPALLTDGNFDFEHSGDLDEDSVNVNFNPPGTPYQGSADSDKDDVYPNQINGLCYVGGWSTVNEDLELSGVLIVGGRLTMQGTLNVQHDEGIMSNPPPGFERSVRPMAPVPGTWRQVVD